MGIVVGDSLKAKTVVTLARLAVGGAIFITHMVTGYNGSAVLVALGLMGVPFEAIQKE